MPQPGWQIIVENELCGVISVLELYDVQEFYYIPIHTQYKNKHRETSKILEKSIYYNTD